MALIEIMRLTDYTYVVERDGSMPFAVLSPGCPSDHKILVQSPPRLVAMALVQTCCPACMELDV